eukprot:3352124-Rhodomonas_salina.2
MDIAHGTRGLCCAGGAVLHSHFRRLPLVISPVERYKVAVHPRGQYLEVSHDMFAPPARAQDAALDPWR